MPPAENDKDLDETKRIMERLVKTPPDPKTGKGEKPSKDSRRPSKRGSDEK